ncbi:reactive intermediate/imine deaminase, partial [Sulfobacillus acidophilus]|nr:reactive intermediate/imine deaminase [Sulfobacillus acidophilus]
MREIITTIKAPKAIGPYNQAVLCKAQETIYVSGQIGLNPHSMEIINNNVAEQTHQALKNLAAVLGAANFSLTHVVKTTVYIKNMDDFDTINEVYTEYFTSNFPAR